MTDLEQRFAEACRAVTDHEPRRVGREWRTRCPSHEDANPSLDFHESDNGKLLVSCRAGCAFPDICDAASFKPDSDFEPDIAFSPRRDKPNGRPVRRRYTYENADGSRFGEKIRFDDNKTPKMLWDPPLKGTRAPLYNLRSVLAAKSAGETIFVVEGERDVETLRGFGLVATTAPHGAVTSPEKWRAEYTAVLEGADVVILQDNDEPGRTHARTVAEGLRGHAKRRILPPFPGSMGFDVSDAVAAGLTMEALLELVEATSPEAEGSAPDAAEDDGRPRVMTIGEFLALEIPPLQHVVRPLLREKGLAMIYAPRGVGKTWAALSVALAAASGASVFGPRSGLGGWVAPAPRNVLFVDGEMQAVLLQERLAALIAGGGFEPENRLRILSADHSERGLAPINIAAGQEFIEASLSDGDLLVLDNVSALTSGLKENDKDSWEPVAEWLIRLRRRGCAVVLIHHAGRNGNSRGTSGREDALDTVVSLRRPEPYSPEEGARMVVAFEKSRAFAGPEAEPFELTLHVEDDAARWAVCSAASVVDSEIIEMRRNGASFEAIGQRFGQNKSTIKRRVDRLAREAS